jgi:hypothetical protein
MAIMEAPPSPEEYEAAWNKIFEVLRPPPRERIHFLRPGYEIQVADFAWASPIIPSDKEGMVHLTGYDENMLNIWYADLEISEVRYVGPKPTTYPNGKNPFPVRPPIISAALLLGRFKLALTSRWLWWKTRHIRKQNLLKYGAPTKETL